jgi:hypothetical protein
MTVRGLSIAAFLAAGWLLLVSVPVPAVPVVFSDFGANPAAIQDGVDLFRAALGDPNNGNAPGPLGSGRREINWDGGGAATTPAGTPFSGFQNNRGALFTTPGTGFVQAPPSGLATLLANPTYSTTFGPFSPQRIFTPLGSNITDVTFFIPGTGGASLATVDGFGAVFSDIDLPTSTRLEFYDVDNALLTSQNVPAAGVADAGLSFLGVLFDGGESIFRVRIFSGTTALGANDNPTGGADLVVLDDLLYSEPVPWPATLGLFAAAVAGLALAGGRASRRR